MENTPVFELYQLERDLTREELVDALSAIPGLLREVVLGADAAALERREDAEAWSAIKTVRHLRDVVQVYGMRFKWMILQDDPLLANYDENAWVASHTDGVHELPALLNEVAAYRAETVRLLRSLRPEGWRRTGRHEVLGSVELEPYVRHELAHEEEHLQQLRQALLGH